MSLCEFSFGKAGKLVNAHSVGFAQFGVVLIDGLKILLENFETIGILLGRRDEIFAVLSLPLLVETAG